MRSVCIAEPYYSQKDKINKVAKLERERKRSNLRGRIEIDEIDNERGCVVFSYGYKSIDN